MENKVAREYELLEITRHANRLHYNRILSDEALAHLDPEGLNVIQLYLIHEHAQGVVVPPHYRCLALLKMKDREKPVEAFIDMRIKDFEALPSVSQFKEL